MLGGGGCLGGRSSFLEGDSKQWMKRTGERVPPEQAQLGKMFKK
jgi:hypothetical protein